MNELPHIENSDLFRLELVRLRELRKGGKIKTPRVYRLSRIQRESIYSKTAGKCHVCGEVISLDTVEADHVKSHSSGGTNVADNFLPACRTCNNYRWHYLAQEFQWILKLGIWARSQIEKDTKLENQVAKAFMAKEKVREYRRKHPRSNEL